MRGADLSRPSVNIVHPAVTYCRHEVAWPLQDTLFRSRRRNVSQSRDENVSTALPGSRVSRTITRSLPTATSTQLDSKQAEDLRHASAERSTSATVGSLPPRKTAPPGRSPREPGATARYRGTSERIRTVCTLTSNTFLTAQLQANRDEIPRIEPPPGKKIKCVLPALMLVIH